MTQVLLIHKLKPFNLANLANFPGGKLDESDYCLSLLTRECNVNTDHDVDNAHINCCVREIREETGLIIDADKLAFVCSLRFAFDGIAAECRFYCGFADLTQAISATEEKIFCAPVINVLQGDVLHHDNEVLRPMGNLAWLCAMAQQVAKRINESTYIVSANEEHR